MKLPDDIEHETLLEIAQLINQYRDGYGQLTHIKAHIEGLVKEAYLRGRQDREDEMERENKTEKDIFLEVLLDAWYQWAYDAKTYYGNPRKWPGGLSTLEAIESILKEEGIIDDHNVLRKKFGGYDPDIINSDYRNMSLLQTKDNEK